LEPLSPSRAVCDKCVTLGRPQVVQQANKQIWADIIKAALVLFC
jgi:hypothetical protein